MKSFLFIILLLPVIILGQNHLLITEIVVTPTAGEFVEIYNNTGSNIDLTNYYLTDATYSGGGAYYYNIVTGSNAGGGSFGDFHARFPAGSSIASGEFQTIAVDGAGFITTHATQPTYELNGTDGSVPDMLEAFSGSINGQGGITNSGEVMVIYYWDGQSDLVQDVDYVVWGDKNEAIDKSGISIDGPDPDTSPTTYLNDTAIGSQISVSSADPHSIGESIQRLDLVEHSENQSGGNGITGNDETSEDLATSFPIGTPNPGSGPSGSNAPLITNIAQSPEIPTPADTVFITADVTDNGAIVSVKLFISINSAPFDSTNMTIMSGNTYDSFILPQSNGTQIEYYIKAEDNDGEVSTSSTFNYTVSAGASPIISNIIQIPGNPTANDTVKISADITDNGSIVNVKLFTSINSAPFDSTNMTLLSGDTYQSTILPQTAGTSVSYYITAEDNDGLVSISNNYYYVVNSGTSGGPHLIFTEIAVVPTAGEFIEIYNNTNSTIDLSNYYLTDATYASGNSYYFNIVTGSNAGGGDFGDFHARFPSGVTIAPGEYQTIAMDGTGFVSTYGTQPTYELYDTDAGISDMLEALSGSINNQGGLTNSGEMAILYYWDGQSDLVQDIDYAVWGDKAEAVDKSGISIDGPDPDAVASSYLNDTPIAQQISISSADPHSAGESIQRLNFNENSEIQSNGNGITGHDETSEDLATSFQVGNPNPGTGPTASNAPVLSNISQQPAIPSPSDSVIISADVTDNGTVVSVKLFTSINSSPFDSTDMFLLSGDTYQGLILPQADGTTVQYYIKAVDNEGLSSITATFNYVVTTGGGITPIANIQNNPGYIGQQVVVEGIVTIGSGILRTNSTDAYVQDNSGRGINIFSFNPPDTNLIRGNLVRISGIVDEYNGTTQILNYNLQLLATVQPLPPVLILSTLEANDISLEGTYIEVRGIVNDKYAAGGGTTIRINDGSSDIDIRAWDTANLNLNAYDIGDTISVKGVMDIYNNTSQILLAYQDDIDFTTLETIGEGSGEVSVTPDAVNTDELVSLDFSFTGTSNDTVSEIDITIPLEWNWTGSSSDVTSSGRPFNSVNVAVNANIVTISNAVLENNLQGSIIINNLTTPAVDTVSQFIIKTGNASRVAEIESHPIVLVGTGTQVATIPIDSIQTDPKWIGQTVTIKAVVSIGAGILRTDYTDSYVQDSTGYGLNVFDFDPPDPNIVKGNLLLMTGLIEEYQGVTEITNYTYKILSTNRAIPGIKEITTNAAATDTSLEGSYIKISGTIIDNYYAGGGTNIIVDDGSGEVFLRIWDSAQLDLSDFNIGDGIVAHGVLDIYSGSGQLMVGYQEDIQHIVLPTVPQFIQLPNKPFVPDRGEVLVIRYSAGSEDTQTTMRVYDLSGRLVTTLLDGSGRSFEQQIKWNGRDPVNDLVPLGTYILHYEVVNNSSGKRWQKAAPIVVGTVLQ